ncbi:MAG: DnaJ domain-containing protein [bacterium]|nr:DnaJ domain-containing protein [bacterium]
MFWKKIILLYLLSIVDFSEKEIDQELSKNVEEVIALYEELKSGSIDYYKIFGLKNTANYNEIKEAYFSHAKKYHPDRISSAPDPEISEMANFVFAEMNKAYETISNDDKRREYDTVGYKENSREGTIKEHLTEKAKLLYRKAKLLYSQKKYLEASTKMDEAISLDKSKASYFLLLGLCQMNVLSLRRMAEKNLQNAIDMEHWNVEAYAAMGMLFLSENQNNRAEGFFRKVLSFNPDHGLARKKLEEISRGGQEQKKSGFSLFGKSKK